MAYMWTNGYHYLMAVNQVSSCTLISHTWVNFNKFSNRKQFYGHILVKEVKQ